MEQNGTANGTHQGVFQHVGRQVWLLSDSAETQKETYKALDAALREQCAEQSVNYQVVMLQDLIMSVERGHLRGYLGMQELIELGESRLSYPLVVKNTRGCRGNAVFLAGNKGQMLEIQHVLKMDTPYLFQQYIKESHGRDVRVMVIGGQVVASAKRISQGGRLQSNFSQGSLPELYPLDESGRNLASRVSEILGMDICAIDLLIRDDGSFCVCEVNSNPGFIPLGKTCNLDIHSLIARHVISFLQNPGNCNNN
ncbi:N-acetylaspartylglutamate synthase A [Pelobates cultripes]|uniref:N-acetylaspartylglutamate synthase n=1 Tax=Pelobates cultripes TaxID=61616 RepID=A0AAD1TDE8_PELCU|nr:N-acetylaspartylglutamate synthase A [Pelobates cultripes]